MLKNALIFILALSLSLSLIIIFLPFWNDINQNRNAVEIKKKIESKAYSNYCVVSSYAIRKKEGKEIVNIDTHQINTQNKWGDKWADDSIFVVIFTNDLLYANELIPTTRTKSPHLFDKNDPRQSAHYCKAL